MLTDDTKFQILHEHYKDSFTQIQEYIKLRDRLFILILIVVTLMLFQIYSPKDSGIAISQFVAKKFELENSMDISFIGSILWFGLLGLVIRYFQTVVHIERQYEYIHNLEEQISPYYDNKTFTKEGQSYLNAYPLFSEWIWRLYTFIFPVLLLIVVFTKIINEWLHSETKSLLLFINAAIFMFILISIILYLLFHLRRK